MTPVIDVILPRRNFWKDFLVVIGHLSHIIGTSSLDYNALILPLNLRKRLSFIVIRQNGCRRG
jgi:hypothetical protein